MEDPRLPGAHLCSHGQGDDPNVSSHISDDEKMPGSEMRESCGFSDSLSDLDATLDADSLLFFLMQFHHCNIDRTMFERVAPGLEGSWPHALRPFFGTKDWIDRFVAVIDSWKEKNIAVWVD